MSKNTPILGLFALAFVSACQKEPVADFISERQFYYAGETIHLKNTSIDGSSYKWTTPGGTYTTKDLELATDITDTISKKEITLEASSKRGSKKNSVTKTVIMRQAILPTDYFAINSSWYLPTEKRSFVTSGYNRIVRAGTNMSSTYMSAQFFGPEIPAAGTYTVIPNYPYIGEVMLQLNDLSGYHTGYTGQVTVTNPSPGWLRMQFSNVTDTYGGSTLAGDITVY